jgi:regulatory protein
MDLLARREHSPAELRRKLADRDFSPGEIEVTLEALIREGLLSEARFLEGFVDSQARRGHGPVWIRAELEKRGVAGDEVAAALAAAGRDWTALAREVRAKRFGAGRPADFRERARQMRFLQYRGFTAAQVREALGSAGDDADGDAPDDGFTAD